MAAKTSLARQLENLKLPQTSLQKEKYGSVSFLYDFFEAKTIEYDTHYSLAYNSLDNLIQIDQEFDIFKQCLFHESSKKFDRAIETKEINDKIDSIIEQFLFKVVSKYFQLTDTQKCLEWLIQKYKVHEFNVDALIGSALPYHETRIFIRLLQTCSAVKNPQNNRFYWMKNLQESGTPLCKSVLVKHCLAQPEFIRFVTDSCFKAIQIDPKNTLFPSFLVSFLLNLLENSTNDNLISLIVSIIMKSLRMKDQQLYSASCMIIAHLCSLTKLSEKIIDDILNSLVRKQKSAINESTMSTCEIIIRTQEIKFLPEYFIDSVIVNLLINHPHDQKLCFMFEAMILTILKNTKLVTNIAISENFLVSLFETSHLVSFNTIKLVLSFIESRTDPTNDLNEKLNFFVIKLIEKMFPSWFDSSLSSMDSVSNISPLLNFSVRYSYMESVRMPLFAGLKHQNEHVRRESIKFFAQKLEKFLIKINDVEKAFVKNIIQQDLILNLDILDPDILFKVFSLKEKLFNVLCFKEFEDLVFRIFLFYSTKVKNEVFDENNRKEWFKLRRLLIEIYTSKPSSIKSCLFSKSFHLVNDMHLILFDHLISSNFQELSLSMLILNSSFSKNDEFFNMIRLKAIEFLQKDLELVEKKKRSKFVSSFLISVIEAVTDHVKANLDVLLCIIENNQILEKVCDDDPFVFYWNRFLFFVINISLRIRHEIQPQTRNTIDEFLLNFLFHWKSHLMGSLSNSKIIHVSQFEKLEVNDVFLPEMIDFDGSSISVSLIGFILYRLIDSNSFGFLPSSIDSYLSDISVNSKFNFYSKIYQFLASFSSPNDDDSTIRINKKVCKFFNKLMANFCQSIIKNSHQQCLNFFIPFLVDKTNSIQTQTLLITNNLLKLEDLSQELKVFLQFNGQSFLFSHFLVLTSNSPDIRQLALNNLKDILTIIANDIKNDWKCLIEWVLNDQQLLSIQQCISSVLNGNEAQKYSKNLINSMAIDLLINDSVSKLLINNTISLIRLLSFSSFSEKSQIFKFYLKKFFSQQNSSNMTKQRAQFSDEEETLIQELLLFFEIDQDLFKDLNENNPCFIFFMRCLENSGSALSESFSMSIFRLLTPTRFDLFCSINSTIAVKIVFQLIRISFELSEKHNLDRNNHKMVSSIRKKLSKFNYENKFIVDLLNQLLPIDDIYDAYTYFNKDAPPEKRIKFNDQNNSFANGWKMFRIFVDIFQNKTDFDSCSGQLIKTLMDYLKLTFMNVGDSSSEFTRQTLLSVIINCLETRLASRKCETENMETDEVIVSNNVDSSFQEFIKSFNVDVIIDCMRESRLKETQRTSFILLSMIAPYFPKQIIDHLVAIFTFIGSNLLQCDDRYSSSVLFETMESIIPIIIEQDDLKQVPFIEKHSSLKNYTISIFVKSFDDIPSYRRLDLFVKLIELLGPEKFLPIVTLRFVEHFNLSKSKVIKEIGLPFLNALFERFSCLIQLKSLSVLLSLFDKKFFDHLKKKSLQQKFSHQKYQNESSTENENPSSIGFFKETKKLINSICKDFKTGITYDSDKLSCGVDLLKFISSILSSINFVSGVRSIDYETISTSLIYILNLVLELIVSLSPSDPSMKSSLNMFRKQIKSCLDELLLKYHALIPTEKLFDIIFYYLLNNNVNQSNLVLSTLVNRKALELMNEKLNKLKSNEIDDRMIMKIIKTMNRNIRSQQGNFKTTDSIAVQNVQLMLLSIKLALKFVNVEQLESPKTIRKLKKTLGELCQITSLIKINASAGASSSSTKLLQNLKGSFILCLTHLLCTLSLEGIEYLDVVVKILLENFDVQDEVIIISNLSALHKIIMKFSQFLSSFLKSIIVQTLPLYSKCHDVHNVRIKLENIWIAIAKNVPKRIVIEAIDVSYNEACSYNPMSVVELMNLFRLSCDYIDRSDIEIIVKIFKSFLTKALSFRSLYYERVEKIFIEQAEQSLSEAFSAFIPKLTESSFRPIFYHLLEWAIQTDYHKKLSDDRKHYTLPVECYHRMISFYRFCSSLADRLKSLFCVFIAPAIMKNCSLLLTAYHSSVPENDDDSFAKGNHSVINHSSQTPNEAVLKFEDSGLGEPLMSAILSTISKCFLYDLNGSFVNKECLTTIVKPIVNQISNHLGDEKDFDNRLELILRCTQYLIQNNKDESLIKDFNYQISLKTKDSQEKTKIGAIKVLHRLILTCGEDYLPFIPETIPFIAELIEDNSELVESHLKKLILDIEQLIGEPINKYL